jgi:hypothetical protein
MAGGHQAASNHQTPDNFRDQQTIHQATTGSDSDLFEPVEQAGILFLQ